jgi:hypothetical protein
MWWLLLVAERLVATEVVPAFSRRWHTRLRGKGRVADGTVNHANKRLVDADDVVARPASRAAIGRKMVRRCLHAWISVGEDSPRVIRADAHIAAVNY